MLTAATVIDDGEFPRPEGAEYSPDVEIVPTLEFPPLMPFTIQVTLAFDVPLTVDVNCRVFPGRTEATVGAMDMAINELDPNCASAKGPKPSARNMKARCLIRLTLVVSSCVHSNARG